MKANESGRYIDIKETEIMPFDTIVTEREMNEMKKRVLENMQEKSGVRKRRGVRAALIAVACAALIPAGALAADKMNLFDKLFGEADESVIENYVEYASTDTKNPATAEKKYTDENDTYKITADYCMYNEQTGAGVLQFTITNKTGDGRKWYEVATLDPYYDDDWEIACREIPEIYASPEIGDLIFMAGANLGGNKVFLRENSVDENTKTCIMLLHNVKREDAKLVVKERQYAEGAPDGKLQTILTVDIPVGESVPTLRWFDEKGSIEAVLSGFDFMVYGIKDGGQDVSVKLKDGTEYHIDNAEKKVLNSLDGSLYNEGIWTAFATLLDLEEVEAFCFDGKEYSVSRAVK